MGPAASTEDFSIRCNSAIAQCLLDRQSGSEIVEAAKQLADAIRPHAPKNKDGTPSKLDAKSLLRGYVDPITGYGLYHTLCFGGYYYGSEVESIKIIRHLIAEGVIDDIDYRDPKTQQNALHIACARGADECKHSSADNYKIRKTKTPTQTTGDAKKEKEEPELDPIDTDIVVFLLSEGVNFALQDVAGRTPLMHAARAMNLVSMRELVGRGACVNVVDKSGKNVFHHFVLAYGTDFYHPELPLEEVLDTLSSLIAVADNTNKNLCVAACIRINRTFVIRTRSDNRSYAPVSVEDFDLSTHLSPRELGKVDEGTSSCISRFGFANSFFGIHRVDPFVVAVTPQPEEPFLLSPFLMLLRELSFNEAENDEDDVLIQIGRVAILKLFLKNGFSILPAAKDPASGDIYHGFYDCVDRYSGRASSRKVRSEHKGAAFLNPMAIPKPLVNLAIDSRTDRMISISGKRIGPVLLQIDRRIVATDEQRNELAQKNSLVASIFLCHYGIFSQILEVCGFSALLAQVGDRNITPLHVLAAIRAESDFDLNDFINQLIECAADQSVKEKYFREGRTFEDVCGSLQATALAANGKANESEEGNNNKQGISPLTLKPSLKDFFA